MSNQNPKVKKIIETLSEGSESVRNNPTEQNYQEWEGRLEKAGSSPNWTAIIFIGVVLLALGFGFLVFSGAAVVAVSSSSSSTTSNSSHPSGASYYNGHYYMVLTYPSSVSGYEASKSYSTTACNNLNGYPAVVSSSEQDFVLNLLSQYGNASVFVCEWNN